MVYVLIQRTPCVLNVMRVLNAIPITLSGKQLKWFSSVKYLGHIFDCCLIFVKDVVCKKGKFVACVNNIVTEIGFVHQICNANMVKMYGTSFYGTCL